MASLGDIKDSFMENISLNFATNKIKPVGEPFRLIIKFC